MKFPNHLILDVSKTNFKTNTKYWIFKYLFIFSDLNFERKNLYVKPIFLINKLNLSAKKFTVKYDISALKTKTANKKINSFFVDLTNKLFLKYLLKNFNFKSNTFLKTFDINFLKKEKIYTKLKYSRVPQYDIVSGGVAAIFAGFLGFLICEKFGFELLDSGDFYFFFMYVVFFFFFF